ncbi:MAG: efflux RND transporter periplasmic adaptor subunit, partial [Rhodospirillales bacterium]|nr:efflux RND transporter periplasmic adaptor subunit [Rhodospirillales bacterium]
SARSEEAKASLDRVTAITRPGVVSGADLARVRRDQLVAAETEQAARHRIEEASIELAAARNGSFLGDSYNDRPSSAQRADEVRQRIGDLTANLASRAAEIGRLRGELAAEEARFRNLSDVEIAMPVSGRVWEVMASPGEQVRRGQDLIRILDCSTAVVTANVAEAVYNRLKIGSPATFHPSDSGESFDGVRVGPPARGDRRLRGRPHRTRRFRRAAGWRPGRSGAVRSAPLIRTSPQELFAAFAPGLAALGLCLLLMTTMKREWRFARLGVMAVSVALLGRYLVWRLSSTLPPLDTPLDFTVGVIFLTAEALTIIASMMSLFFLMRTRERVSDVAANLPWLDALPRKPLIDVLICTYNEEEAIVERTIAPEPDEPPPAPVAARKVKPMLPGRKPVQEALPLPEAGWRFPPLSLLKAAPARAASGPTEESLQANARLLETVLSDYGVQGSIVEIRPGPVVTLYELEPAPGIRSARVIGLADDVARS